MRRNYGLKGQADVKHYYIEETARAGENTRIRRTNAIAEKVVREESKLKESENDG